LAILFVMIKTAVVILSLFIVLPCLGQGDTGFYIEMDKKISCPQLLKDFNGTQTFCITKKPVLDKTVFISTSEIQIDPNTKRKYIDLFLSVEGMNTLKRLVDSLPNASIILVIDNEVIGRLTNKDLLGRFIRIDSDLRSQLIEWIHYQMNTQKED
jgi:hypothetical protein